MRAITLMKKYKKSICFGLMIALCFGIAQIKQSPKQLSVSELEQKTVESVQEIPQIAEHAYYSFLFLGSDKGAQNTNGGNHTDSVTYVAYSPSLNKAYTLPIYRDVIVALVCGGKKNINHVYRDDGADCLMQSVEKLLDLPVDYYVYTTSDAFVRVTDQIGGVFVKSNETFCSTYGNDDNTYCVDAGQAYTMNGNMLLAYARDRNHGSGVPRANRHQTILSGFVKSCLNSMRACQDAVQNEMALTNIAHNLPVHTLMQLQLTALMPSSTFELITMDVLRGTNYADAQGVWHMKPDQDDIQAKKATIEAAFGERTKEH